MIYKGLLIVFISFLCGYGQAQTYVLDSQDNSPIEDVRISYGENEVVIYTNPQGMLDTTTSECFKLFHPAYYLKVACKTDTVYLHKKTQLLKEVVVTDKTICEWAVPKGKKSRNGFGDRVGDMQGVAIGGETFQGHRIGHVRFKLRENLSSDLRVRFHLANLVDTGKSMINPIASSSGLFEVNKKRGWVDFDLSDEYLILPEFQVVLMIEFISNDTDMVISLAAFEEQDYDSYYLRRGLIFKSWRSWTKEYRKLYTEYPTPYFVPAIMVEVCR